MNRSYDRFHDYQRTMQLNYFAPVKLILDLLPMMRERGAGHIINISTMGLQVNTPRFAAYLASKAALDAFSRSIGPEIIGDGVHITTVYMPLVRTPMIAPTKIYDRFPTLSPEEAADMICEAIRKRPKRVATTLGNLGQLTYAIAPGAQDLVVNRAYQLFPEGRQPTPGDRARGRAAGVRPGHPRRALVGSSGHQRGEAWAPDIGAVRITPPECPGPQTRPASRAARAQAPLGSTTSFSARTKRMAATIWSSVTVTTASTRRWMIGQVSSPGGGSAGRRRSCAPR